ncbi:prolyl oligopeptidase family serine peptidase [Candidatus Woesebacteria bacterium]|nr:prolyl oligopeptidase family serine peptidase [Candidatus Woesebacteria bacterium]
MFAIGFGLRSLILRSENTIQLLSPLTSLHVEQQRENPYEKYRFSALRDLQLTPQAITLHEILDSSTTHTSYLTSWTVPNLETGQHQKVSAQINIPQGEGPFPVIIMLRGYADREIYSTGLGTRNAAAAFASNGYITIAPDFLGYGQSDSESTDTLIARFSRPITVLQLLANLQNLSLKLDATGSSAATTDLTLSPTEATALFDTTDIGIWAHSNGGQIALSILEITSRTIPTTLWAPVSKPFPYSVLYFTDELPDNGAYLRQQIAYFEYELGNDPEEFSILHEPARILAPMQIHQGDADDAVPLEWSEELLSTLEEATVAAELYSYPGTDHNMVPNWETAVQRDLQFFRQHLQ